MTLDEVRFDTLKAGIAFTTNSLKRYLMLHPDGETPINDPLFPDELDEIDDKDFQQLNANAKLCMNLARENEVRRHQVFFGDSRLNALESTGTVIMEEGMSFDERLNEAGWNCGNYG